MMKLPRDWSHAPSVVVSSLFHLVNNIVHTLHCDTFLNNSFMVVELFFHKTELDSKTLYTSMEYMGPFPF